MLPAAENTSTLFVELLGRSALSLLVGLKINSYFFDLMPVRRIFAGNLTHRDASSVFSPLS
jgi:hypothetical protein